MATNRNRKPANAGVETTFKRVASPTVSVCLTACTRRRPTTTTTMVANSYILESLSFCKFEYVYTIYDQQSGCTVLYHLPSITERATPTTTWIGLNCSRDLVLPGIWWARILRRFRTFIDIQHGIGCLYFSLPHRTGPNAETRSPYGSPHYLLSLRVHWHSFLPSPNTCSPLQFCYRYQFVVCPRHWLKPQNNLFNK